MKKKSKKRIPQDIKPWVRLKTSEDGFLISAKKTTRWIAGSRRDWNAKVLAEVGIYESSATILKTFLNELKDPISALLQQKINSKMHRYNKMQALCRYKNYCAFTGRARTFNRTLYMARHSVRKLAGIGLISGLKK